MRSNELSKNRIFLVFAVVALFFGAATFALFSAYGGKSPSVFAEQSFSANTNFTYSADKAADYTGLTFEYKITSAEDTHFSLCVIGNDWTNYYGYFNFIASGTDVSYEGVTTESADNGYIWAHIEFSLVTKITGSAPSVTALFFVRGDFSDADGTFKNIEFIEREAETELIEDEDLVGKRYYAGENASIFPQEAKLYEKVVFEYKVVTVGGNGIAVCLLSEDWSKYYGYYYFGTNGLISSGNTSGITVKKLDDGYYRVVMSVPSLKRTNQSDNLNNAPTDIGRIYLRGLYMSDDVYIRNVSFIETSVFNMESGASVRLEKPYGIKFRANIPQSLYDKTAEYGMAIVQYGYLTRYSITGDYVDKLTERGIDFKNAFLRVKETDVLDYYVESYLKDLTDSDLDTEYVGIAYKLKDGVYTYAGNVEGCRRSIREVSEKAVKDYGSFVGYSVPQQDVLLETNGCDEVIPDVTLTANAFDSLENFRKNADVPQSDTLMLYAAKGESEFGQIVLSASAAVADKTYILRTCDLIHTDGSTKLSNDNFDVFNGYYINVVNNWVYSEDSYYSYSTPLLTGWYVDAIIPFYAALTKGEATFDTENGNNRTVYVRFNVPKSQKTGIYSGIFGVYVLGYGYKEIPVEFTVYDFTLPEENNLKSAYGIEADKLAGMFGISASRTTDEFVELYELVKEYGISCDFYPNNYSDGEITLNAYLQSLVDAYNDKRVTTVKIKTFGAYVTYNYSKKSWFSTSEKTYTDLYVVAEDDIILSSGNHLYGTRTTLKKIAEYSIANDIDLFKKLYFHVGDEPGTPEQFISFILSYNACKRGIDYVLNDAGIDWTGHEDIRNSLKNLPVLVDCYAGVQCKDFTNTKVYGICKGNSFVDNVNSQSAYYQADDNNPQKAITITYKYVENYVANYDNIYGVHKDSKTVAILEDNDESTHIWWYGCVIPLEPYQSYHVNSNHVITRSNFWAQYALGVEGVLYYSVDGWLNYDYDVETQSGEYVWLTEEEVWRGESRWADAYGDGTLVYPNVTRYDADFKFVPTYRLVATKEGVDDYNYICYAQKLINRMGDGEKKTAKQTALNECVSSMLNGTDSNMVNSSAAKVRAARAVLAALIESLT